VNSGGDLIISPKREYQKTLPGVARAVAQATSSYFEREPSRSGGEVSPKRESATTPLFHFSSSRLGEGSSPERGKALA